MESFFLAIAVLVGVALLIGIGFWIMRARYVKSLRDKGWEFNTSPDISITHGLNVPPFGMGFERKVDDQILGTASDGTPFSAFEYTCDQWTTMGYAVRMPLGRSLRPAEVTSGQPQSAITGHTAAVGNMTAIAEDPNYATDLVEAALPALPGNGRVTVDHDSIVLTDAPKDADALEAAIEALARVRTALLASPSAAVEGPPPLTHLSFFDRPDWVYIPRDDSFLGQVNYTGGGSDHEAHNIITSFNDGLPFIRLTHRWTTTTTTTDSEGRTTTHTHHHKEDLCEFRTSFPFREISFNWGLFGGGQRFEWERFNSRFKVRCDDPKFASDVVHQQQMEYLMRIDAPPFAVGHDGRIQVKMGGEWLPDNIDWMTYFLRGFFGHVPDFVWQRLGAWPRPIPELEA